MSAQLSVLAAIAESTAPARPPLPPTRDVLAIGASAPSVPTYAITAAPHPITAGVWFQMLHFTERLLRDGTPHATAIDPTAPDATAIVAGAGTVAAVYSGVWFDVERTHLVERNHDHRIPWVQLLAALAAAREDEPRVARARDLAEAYRLRRHMGAADIHAPADVLAALDQRIIATGGDPAAVLDGGDAR